jgi:hypothetical protein
MRFNGLYPALVVLALSATLFIRKGWIPSMWQILTGLAIIEWLRTTIMFVQMRLDAGTPYMRLLVIMGVVILFNVYVLISLRNKKLRAFYANNDKKNISSM